MAAINTASQRSGGVSTQNTAIFFVQAAGVNEQMGSGEAMRSGTSSSAKLKAKERLQSAQKAKQGVSAGLIADAEENSMVTEGESAYGGAFLDQQETNTLQEKEGQRGGQGVGARVEAKSGEQAMVGATALNSEAMEEAASQGAEEAVAEAQGSLAQAGGKAAAGQGSVLGEQLDLSAVQAQATQSQSLLKALATEDESQQEGSLDQAASESSSVEQGSMLTSVDTTLDEIRKLRIIDQELARVQGSGGSAKPGKDAINENLIEERTLSRLKKGAPARDKGTIEDLVHQQIEDQVCQIDDAQLMQSSLDILEYGAQLDTAQPAAAEPQASDKAQKGEKELQMKKREAEAKKKAAEQQQELDRANEGHLKSQAALDDVQVAQTAGTANSRPAGEPLQPSAEASRISMDETFSYQKPKPKAPLPPVDQKKLLQSVVQESLKLSQAKAKEKIVEKEPAKPAPEMKKSNKTEKIAAPKAQVANSSTTAEADKIRKARDLFQAEQNQTKSAPSKPKAAVQNKPAEKPKKAMKKKGAKSAEEQERESGQLDNLFLTLREDLIEGHEEERRKKRRQKKKAKKGKHNKHRKGKHSHSFIEIEATAPKSATLLQLSRSESPDLSPDEGADLSLKRMAARIASNREKGKVRDELAVDLSSADDSEGDSGNKGLAGADRSHDTALKTALREAEAEESLKKAERAANGEGGPEAGNPEPYKTDGYSDKASRRLIEEAESEKDLKYAEKGPSRHSSGSGGAAPANDHRKDHAVKRLLEESDAEDSLKRAEKEGDSGEERAEDGALVQVHAAPPRSVSFVQVGAQVSAQAQAQAQVQAQIQATMQARVTATAQAKAASEALSALGVAQQSQIKTQDQGLIDALQRTLKQMQVKQTPAVAAAAAKKKAVNNIQKALTKKILTRLDDSQPLINVFSKMQSLSKMMPAIQDFERRLNILHQVEPILENAIMTLNKVVDMSATLPVAPPAPAPKPEPAPAAAAAPDLGALKALLAQAQGQQVAAPAAAPEPAPEEEPQEDLAAVLGGGGGGLAGLLAAAGAPAPEPEPAAATGLEALLGGLAPAGEQFAAPFLQAPAAPAAPENPLAALLGGAAGTGLPATDESALIAKLLGGALVQLDSDVTAPDQDQQPQQ